MLFKNKKKEKAKKIANKKIKWYKLRNTDIKRTEKYKKRRRQDKILVKEEKRIAWQEFGMGMQTYTTRMKNYFSKRTWIRKRQ